MNYLPPVALRRPQAIMPGCAFVMFACLALPALGHAQSIKLDGSLGPRTTLTGPAYSIPHDLGQTRGANLFHSFEQFNIQTGESATFTGPNTISRVISRVTGGVQSFIDGLLGTEFAGAKPEFYLINPSGLMFGPNASLNVSGSVHFSTADYLRMVDAARFYSALGLNESVLTVEPIAAFGFLTNAPAPITVQRTIDGFFGGADLSVPVGKTLSFVSGDLTMTADPLLGQNGISTVSAPSGLIQLVSVKSPAEIPANVAAFNINQAGPLGTIAVSQGALINASGDGGGAVVIRAGKLTLDNAFIFADTLGFGSGAAVAVDASLAENLVLLNASALTADVLGEGTGGDVLIRATSVEVDSSFIVARAFGAGQGGNLIFEAQTFTIEGGAQIGSTSFGPGAGGTVTVTADSATLRDASVVAANARGTDPGAGNAGDVVVQAQTLAVEGGAQIGSGSFGPGAGGKIQVTADTVTLAGESADGRFRSGLFANAQSTAPGAGRAGDIEVTAKNLTVKGGAQISSISFGPGAGGTIHVKAEGLATLTGRSSDGKVGSGLVSTAQGLGHGAGNAGNIVVETKALTVEEGAQIGSGSFGPGAGGKIQVTADTVTLAGESADGRFGSGLFANAQSTAPGAGSAGDIEVTAKNLTVKDGAQIASLTKGPGAAGKIDVTSADMVTLTGGSADGSAPSGLFASTRSETLACIIHDDHDEAI